MRIDSHHHFWKYNLDEYEWIDDSMKVIRKDFLPADLQKIMKVNKMEGAVSVQASQTLLETKRLLKYAEENEFIKGVVGWVDLCGKDVEDQLRKFISYEKFVGVRHIVQGEPDIRFLLRPYFMRGIDLLKKYNLTYDILIYPKHLPVAMEFASQFPDQSFVLDHMAKPFIKTSTLEPWRSEIEKLARLPNVYCKVSGMVTEANWSGWQKKDFQPYLEIVYKSFGEDRIMFGSDWPVCLVAASYDQVVDIVTSYFKAKLSDQAMNKLMGLNCINFYKLT